MSFAHVLFNQRVHAIEMTAIALYLSDRDEGAVPWTETSSVCRENYRCKAERSLEECSRWYSDRERDGLL